MRRFWTQHDLGRLRKLYPDNPTEVVASMLGRSLPAVYGTAQKLGISKSAEMRLALGFQKGRQYGVEYQFKKGQVPSNKGLRRPGWAPGRMRETQFRKGARSGIAARNLRPVGTVLSDTDGYLRIKVREAVHGVEATGFGNTKVWPLLQRHVWERANGPVPPSHVIVFRDRDRSNCKIENLECISRADLAYRNRMWGRLPRDLAEAIQLNGVLKRKLRSLANGKK